MPENTAVKMNSVGVILADDLTGACDSAVRILDKHRRVAVLLSSHPVSFNGYSYISVNSNTRSLDPEEGTARIRQILKSVRALNGEIRYKKIDSMLRGNILPELELLKEELGYDCVLIAPGYPENNRIVLDGYLYPEGLHSPVSCKVSEALGLEEKSVCLTHELLKNGPEDTRRFLEEKYREGFRYFIGDSADSEDLETLAETLRRTGLKVLPSGSGGLVRYVFREETKGGSVMPAPAFDDQRIAYIVGSGNPVTVEQVQRLLRKPGVAADAIDLKDAEVSKEWRSLAVTTSRVIKGDPVCAKTVTSNISNREIETELSARAKELYKDGVRKMVVTGGDTANVVLNSLGFSEIEILCESEPGVVLGIGRGENLEPLCVVTKSGGFGTPEAFVKLEKILRNEKGEEHV